MKQAYLLAAGRGRRAGGPKAWLELEGRSLLEKQADFLLKRFPPESIAVSIQPPWNKRCLAISPLIRWVPVDPDASPLASLVRLLQAAPMAGWSIFYHVDMPVWEPGLFKLLDERAGRTDPDACEAIVPVHQGRKGHPVILSPGIGGKLLALDPKRDRLDGWLRASRVETLETPYSCVLENWNSPVRRP